MSSDQQVLQHYYDANTGRFLRFGGSGRSRAIHRGLWEPGVHSAEQAAARINQRIVELWPQFSPRPPGRVRDLGCGVGGTLFHLAEAWPDTALEGITLSPKQAALAAAEGRSRGWGGRLSIRCGDFLDAAKDDGTAHGADLVVAIESHVHAASLEAFLDAAIRGLNADGRLIIVDDMLARPEATFSLEEQALIAVFRRGWRLGHVPDADGLKQAARQRGLDCVLDQDLSEHLRLDRTRDRMLHWLAPIADALGADRWPLFANMIGGNALTLAHQRGLMRYRLIVLQRPGKA